MSTTTTTTAASSSTSSGQSVEDEIIARYIAYWDARFAANSGTPNPDAPALRDYATGAQLDTVVAETQANLDQGLAFRRPANPADIQRVTVVEVDGDHAVVQECVVSDGVIIRRGSGEVVNDEVTTHNVRGEMQKVEGEWRVSAAVQGGELMAHQSTPPSRRTAIVASLVMVALVAGVFLIRLTRDSSRSPELSDARPAVDDPRPRQPAETPGPSAEAAGVPVGFGPGEPGAVAAAVAYATASQRWLYFTDDEIQAAVAEIATPVAAPRLAEDVVADIAMARDQLGRSQGRIWWLVRPLAWRVEHFRDSEARVSVWTVTILSAAGVAAPQSEFLTVTLDLAWVDGDWRVDGVRDSPGPTPITGPQDQPWDAEPFDQALDGFTRVDGEPVS